MEETEENLDDLIEDDTIKESDEESDEFSEEADDSEFNFDDEEEI